MKSVTDWILESDYNEILINRDPANKEIVRVIARCKDKRSVRHVPPEVSGLRCAIEEIARAACEDIQDKGVT